MSRGGVWAGIRTTYGALLKQVAPRCCGTFFSFSLGPDSSLLSANDEAVPLYGIRSTEYGRVRTCGVR